MQITFHKILLIPLLFFIQGCNTLFFYPDKVEYKTPRSYNLKYDDLYFRSFDGTRLHAWRIYAKQAKMPNRSDLSFFKKDSKGLIFVAHGNAQNLSSHFTAWVWLANKGYEIFIFDYRGYGKSEGEADLEGSIKDTASALVFLESIYDKPYFVCGQSLGGSLLINALHKHDKSRIKAVVLDSTFTGFKDIVNEKMDQTWLTWPFQWIPYLTLSSDFDTKDKISYVNLPLLFLHGSSDRTISAYNSLQLFKLSKPPKWFWLVKNAGHMQVLKNPYVQKDFLTFLQNSNFYDSNYSDIRIYK